MKLRKWRDGVIRREYVVCCPRCEDFSPTAQTAGALIRMIVAEGWRKRRGLWLCRHCAKDPYYAIPQYYFVLHWNGFDDGRIVAEQNGELRLLYSDEYDRIEPRLKRYRTSQGDTHDGKKAKKLTTFDPKKEERFDLPDLSRGEDFVLVAIVRRPPNQ